MSNNAALDRLISEKVDGELFGYFFESDEGSFFPDGTEESSGSVVTASGRHFFFWTGWNHDTNTLDIDIWDQIDATEFIEGWQDDSEYLEARRAVGLDVTT